MKTGPQYPAKGGAKISGDLVQGVSSQGALGGAATCEHSQELSPGLLELRTTGDSSASVPTTASVPSQRATPVVVGPQLRFLLRVCLLDRGKKLRMRLAKHARETTGTSSQSELAGPPSQQITEETGPTPQPTPSTSQGTPDSSSGKPEATDTGVPASSVSLDRGYLRGNLGGGG